MQLTRAKTVAGTIATMTSALLGTSVLAQNSAKIESSLLLYSETSRVKAAEGVVSFSKYLRGDRVLTAKLTLDGLTGASPSGATPSRSVQTFTRPSGNDGYTIKAGEIPLDDTFRDTRTAFDASLSQPLGRLTNFVFGGHFSTEHDYTSIGGNAGLTQDLNRKNTTLGLALSYSHDLVRPEGGIKPALTSTSLQGGDDEGEDLRTLEGSDEEEGSSGPNGSKDVFDVVASATQVLNRSTLLRLNYSFSYGSGYLNDPYKILSVVVGPNSVDAGEPVDYLFENRPGSHTKHSVYGEIRKYMGGHVVDLSYRFFSDDWGIRSHTAELFYRLPVSGRQALQPHVRWYHQGAADFYKLFLLQDEPLPQFASADYRLAKFDAYTLGLQYFLSLHPGYDVNIGVEYYLQRGDQSPPEAFGSLRQFRLFPDMNALMIRLGISHGF